MNSPPIVLPFSYHFREMNRILEGNYDGNHTVICFVDE